MRAPARSACFTGLAFLFFTICQIAWADDCPNGILPPGTGQDIVISVSCAVDGSAPNGLYQYGNVNIIANGKLTFDDVKVDFWAKNILVENNGSLLAGTTMPVGTNGGSLTIHLYGPDQGPGGKGVACVSDDKGQCGIPDNIWDSNGSEKVCLNGVQQNCSDGILDYFYQYMPIDYDDGNPQAYFGYKVLAVSYGGTLELFGAKGATYSNLPISSSGTSWARLNASVTTTSNTLTLDRVVDWKNGDQIVVTTTDYLPGHSEQLTVTSNTVMGTYSVIGFKETLQYPHNGQQYPIAATVPAGIGPDPDPNLPPCNPQLPSLRCVDTRAAVGLLTHSIRIVSGGDTLLAPFPAPSTYYYFGGHTLFRQGFKAVEIQGVEFAQLGQGGKIMHYPVHFHMARITNPANTYVLDSSINESMTRWIVIHSTQDVTVARNVGWESIGHGYYLEDGTEAYNKFYSNLGIFARAAVMASNNSAEKYNPRHVPGILAAPYPAGGSAQPQEQVPYHSDVDHPTDFWITNGWNDFGYNHMAGAGTCGLCYWLVPAYISGASRSEKWEGYAGEQFSMDMGATTPLKSFVGNSCSTAMMSFNTVGDTSPCNGVVNEANTNEPHLIPVPSPAPAISDPKADAYYPKVLGGGGRFATECPNGDCSNVTKRCDNGQEQNCAATILDHFTSSFSWAQTNFGSVWFRPQWYLYINSALTDVQNGGLTIVTGGGYTESDSIFGHWALAKKDVFVGNTQNPKLGGSKYASNAGPVTPNTGLSCAKLNSGGTSGSKCLVRDPQGLEETVALQTGAFANNQRLLNIYDGPAYESSNAFLDITPTTGITGCNNGYCGDAWGASSLSIGVAKDLTGACYLPNAAIAWKQPNGFFYPPAFHSQNLFYSNVTIRHFVIEPQFLPGTYQTDQSKVVPRYCGYPIPDGNGNGGLFTGFSDIDRQTELNDDDGSLTGLKSTNVPLQGGTISVNEDPFFRAPVETDECASNIPSGEGATEPIYPTAKTSPYDYVTTVVYPSCGEQCNQSIWTAPCTTPACFGVPLYREYVNQDELGTKPFIRMASQAIGQRSNLTPNNGSFYIDTTTTPTDQQSFPWKNIFQANQKYYVFLLFAKPSTTQTYSMYVGPGFDKTTVLGVRMHQTGDGKGNAISFDEMPLPSSWGWTPSYNANTGVLTVTMNMDFTDFQNNYNASKAARCEPQSFCTMNGNACGCALAPNDPLYKDCKDVCSSGADPDCPNGVCTGWASKDVDCPENGCYGFAFITTPGFTTGPKNGLPPTPGCYDTSSHSPWNLQFGRHDMQSTQQCYYTTVPTIQTCSGKQR